VLGTGTLAAGSATVSIPAGSLNAGAHSLTAEYSGDANVGPSTDGLTVTVTKAASTTTAKVKPGHPKAHHKVKLKVTVAGANGVVATGEVTVKVNGKKLTGTLKNGKLTVKLGSFAKGDYKAKVVYDGDGNVAGSKTKVKFTVT
jgi:5'-nucleotidase